MASSKATSTSFSPEWWHPRIPKRASHRAEVYRQELRERAALLYRLRFPAAEARQRLVARVEWDYEVGPASMKSPIAAAEVGAIVDAVYARHGAGGGPLTV
jgi:hypothetical protein